MDALTTVLQVVSLVSMAAALVLAAALAIRWRAYRCMVLAPAVWAGLGVVFYVLLLAGRFSDEAAQLWSDAHRFMAALLILGVLLVWIVLSDESESSDDEWDGRDE